MREDPCIYLYNYQAGKQKNIIFRRDQFYIEETYR